jgi:hypothetical protein
MSQNYNFIPSVLHVVAQELDLSKDFETLSDKTIDELLNEEKTSSENQAQSAKETKE